jgi:hypothetical protein
MEFEQLDDGTFIHIQSGFVLEPPRAGKYRVIGKMEDGGELRDIDENDKEEASQLGFATEMEIVRLDDGTFIHTQSGFILEPMLIGKYRVIGKMEDGEIRDIDENDMEEASQLGFVTE